MDGLCFVVAAGLKMTANGKNLTQMGLNSRCDSPHIKKALICKACRILDNLTYLAKSDIILT